MIILGIDPGKEKSGRAGTINSDSDLSGSAALYYNK